MLACQAYVIQVKNSLKKQLNGINIICIPGPCAALTALVASGLPSSKFTFEGFLPKRSPKEKNFIEMSKNDKTTILFEAPHRLKKLLKELKEYFERKRNTG